MHEACPCSDEDDGLVELMWCSGHAVMQSQAPRRPVVQDQEVTPWFQYLIADDDDDSLEKVLFSEIFGEMPADAGRPYKEEDKERGAADAVTALRSGVMPTPLLMEKVGLWDDVGDDARSALASEASKSVVATISSRSVCGGSNQAQTPGAAPTRVVSDTTSDNAPPPPLSGGKARHAWSYQDASTILTSPSKRPRPPSISKWKQSDAAESASEDVEESQSTAVTTYGLAKKPSTAKRQRAAQLHNLSEKRRRDRINEKMKALQELIPHCNKTDKASMLDEAVEYLKSLQLQLQMMRAMGGGMALASAPMMSPAGAHQ